LHTLILWTDGIVNELELANLSDVQRLPADWRRRLAPLFFLLPFDLPHRLPTDLAPVEVLDLIYDVQARLFALQRASRRGRTLPKRLTG
jgi:hypothetical protein